MYTYNFSKPTLKVIDEKERRNLEEKNILEEELNKYFFQNKNKFKKKKVKDSSDDDSKCKKKSKKESFDDDKSEEDKKKNCKKKSKKESSDDDKSEKESSDDYKSKKGSSDDDSKSEEDKNMKCKKKFKKEKKIESSEDHDSESEEEEKETKISINQENIKCSLSEHMEIKAIIFCPECNIYMCNKCEKLHLGLFKNHHQYTLDENNNEIFTGLCMKKNHSNKLEYFCKTHNQLCCAACIAKIRGKGYGSHKNCKVCFTKKIKNKKIEILNQNIDFLSNLSNNIENSINQLKTLFEKIEISKEEIKKKVQKIFTNLRNALNNREDELLSEIDEQYNDLFFDESLVKKSEKMPEKIRMCMEKGKKIGDSLNADKDNNKLSSLINDCINVENHVLDIKKINSTLKRSDSYKNIKIKFLPNENEINNFLEFINKFGKITNNDYKYKFKKCPLSFDFPKEYNVYGVNDNFLIKTGPTSMKTYICEYELINEIENKWKIEIVNSKSNHIMVGITTIDCNLNILTYNRCGWYISCFTSKLYSGPPHNYNGKETNLNFVKRQIAIIMDMKKGTLKFIFDGEDKGESYTNIPLDKPIFPVVILYDTNDEVKISECYYKEKKNNF